MNRIENFRLGGAAFFRRRDTAIVEFGLAISALINAFLVNGTGPDGQALAPFTTSALQVLAMPKILWVVALIVLGMAKMGTLILGLIAEMRGIEHRYLQLRGAVTFIATLVWCGMVIAILTGHQPLVVALRYALSAMVSILAYIALAVQHHAYEMELKHPHRETDTCTMRREAVEREVTRSQIDYQRQLWPTIADK